jgi:hypothetical protein
MFRNHVYGGDRERKSRLGEEERVEERLSKRRKGVEIRGESLP